MTYINENWEITTKGEPDPVINLECYRLVLYHEMSDGTRRIQLESPRQVVYCLSPFDDHNDPKIVINTMLEKFRSELVDHIGG